MPKSLFIELERRFLYQIVGNEIIGRFISGEFSEKRLLGIILTGKSIYLVQL